MRRSQVVLTALHPQKQKVDVRSYLRGTRVGYIVHHNANVAHAGWNEALRAGPADDDGPGFAVEVKTIRANESSHN